MPALGHGLRGIFTGFVNVTDTVLVEQDSAAADVAHLNGISVIPFNYAFQLLAVFQNDHHAGLGLNLFLEIKYLGVGTVFARAVAVQRSLPPRHGTRRQGWADQAALPGKLTLHG